MFEKVKARYEKGWVTLAQLHRYVELGVINASQYTEICGETYAA